MILDALFGVLLGIQCFMMSLHCSSKSGGLLNLDKPLYPFTVANFTLFPNFFAFFPSTVLK